MTRIGNPWYKNPGFWLLLPIAAFSTIMFCVFCAALSFNVLQAPRQTEQESLTEAAQDIQRGQVSSVTVNGTTAALTHKNGQVTVTEFPQNPGVTFENTMVSLGVTPNQLLQANINYVSSPRWDRLLALAGIILLALLTIGTYLLVLLLKWRSSSRARPQRP